MKRNEVDRCKLSPMMKHYVELKDKYEDTILLESYLSMLSKEEIKLIQQIKIFRYLYYLNQ